MKTIVSTHNLSKRDGRAYRVRDVNLTVNEGEVYGFLGPNGAGKSTTLKLLLGLVKPSEGRVEIFGKDLHVNRQAILAQTGALIESPAYYAHLTGLENMRVAQRLRNVPNRNVEEVLSIVRLDKQKEKKVGEYSLGMKQRLGIAMALLSFPKLLILDEPTNGLDPAGIEEIRELIQTLPQRFGMTVLLSSHLLAEIEQVATSVGIIQDGSLLFQGSMDELRGKNQATVAIKTTDNQQAMRILQQRGVEPLFNDGYLCVNGMPDHWVAEANRALVRAGVDVIRIEERKKSLERIFLDITGGGRSL